MEISVWSEQTVKREEIFEYVKKRYGTTPEYLWRSSPDSAVLRHENGKWYAVFMVIDRKKLGFQEEGVVDIIDVKCDPEMIGMILQTRGFLPGYHMNKQHWITILLDGTVGKEQILDFLDLSNTLVERLSE